MQRWLILGLIPLTSAWAEPLTITIDPVITPTGLPTPLDTTPAAVSVIEAEALQRSGAPDLAELLRFNAGLEIARNGGPGSTTSLFLRGTDSNHTLVLVDGVAINPGTIGGAALQNLDPSLFDRVEIVKGGRSALYGSEAIGGVVQLFSRPPDAGSTHYAAAGLGADATHQLRVGWLTPQAGLRLAYQDTNGFPAQQGGTDDHGYDNLGLVVYGQQQGWYGGHWQASGTTEYQGFHPVTFVQGTLRQDFRNSATQLRRDWEQGLVRLSYVTDHIDQQDSQDYAHTERWQLDWQQHGLLNPSLQWTGGLSLSTETTAARSFGTEYDEATAVHEAWGQLLWRRAQHELQLAVRLTDHATAGTEPGANLAYAYHFSPDTYAYASVSRAFRAPDGTDRFGFGGNPDLKPERAVGAELGLRHDLSLSQRVSVQVFRTDIDDLISFNDPDGFFNPLPGRNENIDQARIQGLELGYEYQAAPWTLRLEALWQDPENRADGQTLARRSARSLTARLGYTTPRWRLQGQCLASSQRRDSDFSDAVLAGYGVCHLVGAWTLAPDWQLRGRVENLFDRDYELADGFNIQRRALWLSLEYRTW